MRNYWCVHAGPGKIGQRLRLLRSPRLGWSPKTTSSPRTRRWPYACVRTNATGGKITNACIVKSPPNLVQNHCCNIFIAYLHTQSDCEREGLPNERRRERRQPRRSHLAHLNPFVVNEAGTVKNKNAIDYGSAWDTTCTHHPQGDARTPKCLFARKRLDASLVCFATDVNSFLVLITLGLQVRLNQCGADCSDGSGDSNVLFLVFHNCCET